MTFAFTYKFNIHPASITCLVCDHTSYDAKDIVNLYCPQCKAVHKIAHNDAENIRLAS